MGVFSPRGGALIRRERSRGGSGPGGGSGVRAVRGAIGISRQGGFPLQVRQLRRMAGPDFRETRQPAHHRCDGCRLPRRRACADRLGPQRERTTRAGAQAAAGRIDGGPAGAVHRPRRQRPPGRDSRRGQGAFPAHRDRVRGRAAARQRDQFRRHRRQGPVRRRAPASRSRQPEDQLAAARGRAQSGFEAVMSALWGRSLRQKLFVIVLLTTLVALVVALGAIIGYDLRTYHRTIVSDMTTQAALLGRTTVTALAFDDPKAAAENLSVLRFRPAVSAAALYNARGALFATYTRQEEKVAFPKLPEVDGMRIEDRDLVLFKRIVNDGEILGTVYLRADYELFDRVLDYLGIAAVVLLAAMSIAALLASWMQRFVSRPVLAIAQIAREVVEKRDYSRRAQKLSADEVGTLADSFNGMLAEIDRRTRELEASNAKLAREAEERSRAEREIMRLNAELEDRVRERTTQLETANKELEAFSYSVSHDLRAPLRSIDGFGQALVDDFPQHLPEAARRYLDRIRTATKHMGQLIEDLLNLARVSRGTLERRLVDLSQIARQVVGELQQRDPGRTVEVSIWEGMSADADAHLLRIVLENLLGNAW